MAQAVLVFPVMDSCFRPGMVESLESPVFYRSDQAKSSGAGVARAPLLDFRSA
jgi:hypothetical protein